MSKTSVKIWKAEYQVTIYSCLIMKTSVSIAIIKNNAGNQQTPRGLILSGSRLQTSMARLSLIISLHRVNSCIRLLSLMGCR